MAALDTLTDKEKETLRLIVRGHDAKSAASALDLSVHTINDRLRAARRKLDVTSSREAARLLFESEESAPENLAPHELGNANAAHRTQSSSTPTDGPDGGPVEKRNFALMIGGVLLMSLALIALVLAAAPESPTTEAVGPTPVEASSSTLDQLEPQAEAWLALIDAGNWSQSHREADPAFRAALPLADFQAAMEQSRMPLGEVERRVFLNFGSVSQRPATYRIVQFRTDFSNSAGVIETVTFSETEDGFAVSGYWTTDPAESAATGPQPQGVTATLNESEGPSVDMQTESA